MSRSALPIAVVGAGPAGQALTLALASRGQTVVIADPGGLRPSDNTLGAFADDLPPGRRGAILQPTTLTTDAGTMALPAYARVDVAGLAAEVRSLQAGGQLRSLPRRILSAHRSPGGLELIDEAGQGHDVVAAIDTTGAAGTLLRREPSSAAGRSPQPRCRQLAFGMVVRGHDPHLPPTGPCAVFMDWSSAEHGDDRDANVDQAPPSFLYVLRDADGHTLYEETILATRQSVPADVLAQRLRARLARRGVRIDAVETTEWVDIPLDLPLPVRDQLVGAFGAAAAMVSPLSGYQVGSALRLADQVAEAVVASLARDVVDPVSVANAVHGVVWSADRRAVHALQRFGLEVLLDLHATPRHTAARRALGAFFVHFFAQPQARAWLAGTLDAAGTRAAMWRFFQTAPWNLRRVLMAGLRHPAARPVLRDLLRRPSSSSSSSSSSSLMLASSSSPSSGGEPPAALSMGATP